MELALLGVVATVVAVLWAAVSDMTNRTVPNPIPFLIAVGFILAALTAPSTVKLVPALAAGAGVLAVTAGMFAVNWIGGGDAKLMAALALWSGLEMLPQFLLVTAVTGGILGVVIWLWRLMRRHTSHASGAVAGTSDTVPYAIAIACGGLTVLAHHLEANLILRHGSL